MEKLTRHHIGIVATGILLCFAPATMLMNSWSIFVVPVSEAMGVGTDVFSLMPSIIYLSGALLATPVGKLIERFDLRAVLTSACVIGGVAICLCGACTAIWQLFLLAVLEGYGGVVLLFLMLPNLIGRWFYEKMGTVVGICIASAGFGMALWAYLGGVAIVVSGWRAAYLLLGAIALLLSLPACFLLLKNRPEDVGVRPYGAPLDRDADADPSAFSGEGSAGNGAAPAGSGVLASRAVRSSTFVLYVVAMGLLDGAICLANLLPTYVYYLGDAAYLRLDADEVVLAASSVALCTQAAQACFKLLLGAAADRNVKAAYVFAVLSGIAGIVCFLFGRSVLAVILLGGVLFGSIFCVLDVLSPVLMRGFFGDRDYSAIYSRFGTFVNLVPAFAVIFFAKVCNISWTLTFVLGGAFLATTLGCGLAAMRQSKKLKPYFCEEEPATKG